MTAAAIITMASTHITVTDWRALPGTLSEDHISYEFPRLMSVNSHGRQTMWQISVRLVNRDSVDGPFLPIADEYFDNRAMSPEIVAWTKVSSGVVGGKVRLAHPTITTEGKNIGRRNETNVFCQALRDALGLHNKKLKTIVAAAPHEDGAARYPPMLAQVLKTMPDPPVYVQRKYNGVRAVAALDVKELEDAAATSEVVLYSRTRLPYPGFSYLRDELRPMLVAAATEGLGGERRQIYLDGEIYLHGKSLQDISGMARRGHELQSNKPQDGETVPDSVGGAPLEFMVYDCFDPRAPDLVFAQRLALLREIFDGCNLRYAHLAPTALAASAEEVTAEYQKYLAEGYEGAMVRPNVPYRYSNGGYHSANLLKLKPTFDEEYRVVGWETGERGKAADLLMLICEVAGPDGTMRQFAVTPAATEDERRALAARMNEIVEGDGAPRTYFDAEWRGAMVRVYFDELSNDGVPQRGRTKLERLGREIIK